MSLTLWVYVLGALAIALLLVDCSQTRYIAKHPEQFVEGNIVMGVHPSLTMVHSYFAVWMAIVAAAVYYLPPDPALVSAEIILIAVEGYVTWRNRQKGIGLA